jgi:hypothetical protein
MHCRCRCQDSATSRIGAASISIRRPLGGQGSTAPTAGRPQGRAAIASGGRQEPRPCACWPGWGGALRPARRVALIAPWSRPRAPKTAAGSSNSATTRMNPSQGRLVAGAKQCRQIPHRTKVPRQCDARSPQRPSRSSRRRGPVARPANLSARLLRLACRRSSFRGAEQRSDLACRAEVTSCKNKYLQSLPPVEFS